MTTTPRITTTAAVILSLVAAGASAAGARPAEDPATATQTLTTVYSRPDKALIPVTSYGGRILATSSVPQPVVRIQTPPSGFDWGDAGIGAAGGLALGMLGLGGGLVIAHQRPRRTRPTPGLPS